MSNARGNNGSSSGSNPQANPFTGPPPMTGQPPQNVQRPQPIQAHPGPQNPQLVRPIPVRAQQGMSISQLLNSAPVQPQAFTGFPSSHGTGAPQAQPPQQPVSHVQQALQAPPQQAPQQTTTTTTTTSSSGQPERAKSPGGTVYERNPKPTSKGRKSRREAAGYDNPSHSHGNMIPLWRKAALSPNPFAPGQPQENPKKEREHLMDKKRRFKTQEPDGTPTEDIQGHDKGVLGHFPDASEDWNQDGHKRPRTDNREHNKETSTYHGIESRGRSNASGSSAPRYDSPRPDSGSHPSHWNTAHSGFIDDVPWSSWTPVPVSTNNNNNNASTSSSSGYGQMPSVQGPQRPQPSTPSSVRPQTQLSTMAPPPQHQGTNQLSPMASLPTNAPSTAQQLPVLSPFMATSSHGPQTPSVQPQLSLFPPVSQYPSFPPPQLPSFPMYPSFPPIQYPLFAPLAPQLPAFPMQFPPITAPHQQTGQQQGHQQGQPSQQPSYPYFHFNPPPPGKGGSS